MAETNPGRGKSKIGLPAVGAAPMAGMNPARGKSRVGLPAVGATQAADSNAGRGKSRVGLPAVKVFPGSPSCRARRYGKGTHVECLAPPAEGCDFAAPTGTGTLCIHPKRLDIVAHSEAGWAGGAQA
ncbi:MAG: hypothetical protein NT105_16295 [Verrucomicrobia bacterium]|nr:hypothetical protein [Verrucomicrobiota bacterium]